MIKNRKAVLAVLDWRYPFKLFLKIPEMKTISEMTKATIAIIKVSCSIKNIPLSK